MPTIQLTPRQHEVACELACDGATNHEIAERLSLDVETVKSHLAAIRKAAGITDRTALAVALIRKRVVVVVPANAKQI